MPLRPDSHTRELQRAWRFAGHEGGEHFAVLAGVLRVHELLASRLDAGLARFQLRRGEYLLLMTLVFADGPMAPAELSRRMLMHPATITATLDRLEGRELIGRVTHPTDRRSMLAEITDPGAELARLASESLVGDLFGLGQLSADECASVSEALDRVWEVLEPGE